MVRQLIPLKLQHQSLSLSLSIIAAKTPKEPFVAGRATGAFFLVALGVTQVPTVFGLELTPPIKALLLVDGFLLGTVFLSSVDFWSFLLARTLA